MDKQIHHDHSGNFKTNRFQSGFRDLKKKFKQNKQENIKILCRPVCSLDNDFSLESFSIWGA